MTRMQIPVPAQVDAVLDEIQRSRVAAIRLPVSVERCLVLAELAEVEAVWWAEVFESARVRVQWRAALAARERALHTAHTWRARADDPQLPQTAELQPDAPGVD